MGFLVSHMLFKYKYKTVAISVSEIQSALTRNELRSSSCKLPQRILKVKITPSTEPEVNTQEISMPEKPSFVNPRGTLSHESEAKNADPEKSRMPKPTGSNEPETKKAVLAEASVPEKMEKTEVSRIPKSRRSIELEAAKEKKIAKESAKVLEARNVHRVNRMKEQKVKKDGSKDKTTNAKTTVTDAKDGIDTVKNNVEDLKNGNSGTLNKCLVENAGLNGVEASFLDSQFPHEDDISAFGFGGNFALASGSPIHRDKHSAKNHTSIDKNDMNRNITENQATENKKVLNRRETFVMPKPVAQKKEDSKKQLKGLPKPNVGKKGLNTSKSARDLSKTDRQKLKTSTSLTDLSKVSIEPDEDYTDIENPFKPSKTLVRSPPKVYVSPYQKQDGDPEKIDAKAFVASIRQSTNERRSSIVLPLPESSFADEPTRYFNTDMEFTAVIDSSKLLQGFRADKSAAENDKTEIAEKTGKKSADKQSKNKTEEQSKPIALEKEKEQKHVKQRAARSKHATKSGDSGNEDASDGSSAAVEMRTKKPGVFTFNVGRKEADGTRKPVPENTSSARSKKKIITPEKEEVRNTGEDRDMFNFGDRTPTMPLDRLPKQASKNVYDLSINESIVQTGTLKNLREDTHGKKTKLPNPKPGEHIYYLPLKGSPEEKKEPVKRSRSKSGTRSKSRKRASDDDDDDEWVPGIAKSKSRSLSRGRSLVKKSEDKSSPRRGRSRSRRRKPDDENHDEEDDQVDGEKKETVSHKKSPLRRGRSRSRKRKSDEMAACTDEEEVVPVRRGRSRSRDQKRVNDEEEEMDKVVDEEKPAVRKGRSKSQARKPVLDKNDDAEGEVESEDQKTIEKQENKVDNEDNEVDIKRKSRSKHVRKNTYTLEEQNAVEDMNEAENELELTFTIEDSDTEMENTSGKRSRRNSFLKSLMKEAKKSQSNKTHENTESKDESVEKDTTVEESFRLADTFVSKARGRKSRRLSHQDPDSVFISDLDQMEEMLAKEGSRKTIEAESVRKRKSSRKSSRRVKSDEDDKSVSRPSSPDVKKSKSKSKSTKKKNEAVKEKEETQKKSKAKLQMVCGIFVLKTLLNGEL